MTDLPSLIERLEKAQGLDLWHVCWAAEVEDIGFKQHKGPVCSRSEAERRLSCGRAQYPWIIYWLEPAALKARQASEERA